MTIHVLYDGEYPNLCSGKLVVSIDGHRWEFPDFCLSSGGNVWFDSEWDSHVEYGPWEIREYPKGFPEDLKAVVLQAVKDEIPWGCCGGCI